MKLIREIAFITLLAGLLAGCHTVGGVGQDVSAGGHAITRAAQ